MKRLLLPASLAGISLAVGLAASATAQTTTSALPTAVSSALYAALDDEYHAQTFYAAVMQRHGEVRPFSNIIRAEQRHSGAVAELLQRYGMQVPANPYATGAKPIPAVSDNLQEVCAAGVQAEIANVQLYDTQLLPAVAGYADISQVLTALRNASQDKHLPAFQRCAAGQMGGGHGQGKGQGMGQGKGHGKGQGMGQGGGQQY